MTVGSFDQKLRFTTLYSLSIPFLVLYFTGDSSASQALDVTCYSTLMYFISAFNSAASVHLSGFLIFIILTFCPANRAKRSIDYPGLAFGSAMFGSDTLMKFSIIKNELHNIMRSHLKRVDGEVVAMAQVFQEI